MEEIRALKDKNKELNDEERRKNAENLILKISQMMELGEDEEDYDEEEPTE